MKKIVLACGSGIATSTAVANKVSAFLNENGMAGQYTIVQCAIAEAPSQCADAVVLISTTVPPAGITCPYVNRRLVPYEHGVAQTSSRSSTFSSSRVR